MFDSDSVTVGAEFTVITPVRIELMVFVIKELSVMNTFAFIVFPTRLLLVVNVFVSLVAVIPLSKLFDSSVFVMELNIWKL